MVNSPTSFPSVSTPFAMIIFGATGDLAQNKLVPALFSLFKEKQLPDRFYIVGFARREFSDDAFRELFPKLKNDPEWNIFSKHLLYQQGNFNEEKGYQELITKLNSFDEKEGACITRLFYLATPPANYEAILDNLSLTELSEGCGQGSNEWTRIIIEKPFGKDIDTARLLDKKLGTAFDERQIFRVDHYLAKETMQNILAFRFANSIFEPVWNNKFIDHVQITWSQDEGLDGRGNFFDGVGILRDVAQNHLLQFVAAVAMEQPTSFTKEGVREARAQAIASIISVDPNDVVRGQYEGYTKEKGVQPNSQTETFTAMKLSLNSKRFEGVPFYLRAGKKMQKEFMDIKIVFIQTCHLLFHEYGCPEIGNVLTFRIQPNEGIGIRVMAKKPGNKLALDTVNLTYSYKDSFTDPVHDAYEKLLLDIFAGDQMLFNRSDELESSWQLITNILKGWEKETELLTVYKQGSSGPKSADELLKRDGRSWL